MHTSLTPITAPTAQACGDAAVPMVIRARHSPERMRGVPPLCHWAVGGNRGEVAACLLCGTRPSDGISLPEHEVWVRVWREGERERSIEGKSTLLKSSIIRDEGRDTKWDRVWCDNYTSRGSYCFLWKLKCSRADTYSALLPSYWKVRSGEIAKLARCYSASYYCVFTPHIPDATGMHEWSSTVLKCCCFLHWDGHQAFIFPWLDVEGGVFFLGSYSGAGVRTWGLTHCPVRHVSVCKHIVPSAPAFTPVLCPL